MSKPANKNTNPNVSSQNRARQVAAAHQPKPASRKYGIVALILVISLLAVGGAAFALLGKPGADTQQKAGAPTAPVQNAAANNADGGLVIPVSKVSSKATFYPATVDGVKLEVLAVKAPDGSIRTAFNTCQVCYDSGRGYYKQEGDALVCQNCGNRFKISQVEVSKGGCNPVPIFDKEIEMGSENITIPAAYLKEAKDIFENWKTT